MTRSFKTIAVSSLAGLALLAAAAAPAQAGWHGGWRHGGWGGPAALGLFGGLAAGAIIASQSRPAYYGNYGYSGYSGYSGDYGDCYLERKPVVNRYGYIVGYRKVQVCD